MSIYEGVFLVLLIPVGIFGIFFSAAAAMSILAVILVILSTGFALAGLALEKIFRFLGFVE